MCKSKTKGPGTLGNKRSVSGRAGELGTLTLRTELNHFLSGRWPSCGFPNEQCRLWYLQIIMTESHGKQLAASQEFSK